VAKQEKAIRIAPLTAGCGQRIGMLSLVRRSLPRRKSGRLMLTIPERRIQMDKVKTSVCPVTGGCDKISCLLSKVGITRSLLITLAILPYAWKGTVLCAEGITALWGIVTNAVK
jgi:hypothetical protein